MKIAVEWNDQEDLHNEVVKAIEEGEMTVDDGYQIDASSDIGEYGDIGYVIIKTPCGRRFQLDLHELI